MVPPTNQTKLEGEKVQFSCEAKALPGNVTVRWFREGAPVTEVSALDTRVSIKIDGSLVINPVSADDSGQYLCEVTNGIGDPQTASAYLNVECKTCFNVRIRENQTKLKFKKCPKNGPKCPNTKNLSSVTLNAKLS